MLRKTQKGYLKNGFRSFEADELNGVILKDTKGSNKIRTSLTNVNLLSAGEYNELDIASTYGTWDKGRTITNILSGHMGKANRVRMLITTSSMPSEQPIAIGDNNYIEINKKNRSPIAIGSKNFIQGEYSIDEAGVEIGDNNILINFNPRVAKGTEVQGAKKKHELLYATSVSNPTEEGSLFIEVESLDKVMCGENVYFGTVASAYAQRRVTKAANNKIYFKEPLSKKECSLPGMSVYNDIPEKVEKISIKVKSFKQGARRVYVDDASADWHLKDLSFGSLKTKALYADDITKMLFLKHPVPFSPEGTPPRIIRKEKNPYSDWNTSSEKISDKVYQVENISNRAYIGRKVGASEIVAFDEDEQTITLSEDMGDATLLFPDLGISEDAYYEVSTSLSKSWNGNEALIEVDSTDGFYIGQTVSIPSLNFTAEVTEVMSNSQIALSKAFFPSRLENSCYIGRKQLVINESEDLKDIIAYLKKED